ncbi:tyrosine-type recombinase/integrase [Calycomorphotria hydatis]|uniref:Phage integrase family protein n=1 Tax=Calycomorphotria hydatis TaxID=2528027 RepID=A0A517TE68_9PLAN|nr:site-specific integrase [Calycomorphotria hydatis]QDT66664.1 hypothetical protein V22_39350 [Calycomorphotria hydatis]
MARPPRLNWDDSRRKWRVVYRGKKYRFDGGTGKSDREAKRQAEVEWREVKTRLDLEAEEAKPHRQEYRNVIAEWDNVLRWATEHGDDMIASQAREKIHSLEERLSLRVPPPLAWSDRFFSGPEPLTEINEHMAPAYRSAGLEPIIEVAGPVPAEHSLWKDRLAAQDLREKKADSNVTFVANVDRFLKQKRTEVAAGQLSAARAESLRTYLEIVMNFTGRTTSVQRISGATLTSFRQHLLERVSSKEISDYYARDVFAAFKLFVKWLANDTDVLENLPRNIDAKGMSISIAERKAKTLTAEQIKILLRDASQRTRLYLLLGLNCAMTQIDMSDLRYEEVDWENGIITRKRSKTSDCESVPEVSWVLWPLTQELLKKERSTGSEYVLLTRDGQPLRTDHLEGGSFKKTDAVRAAVRRLAVKTDVAFTVKALKKTSASLLRSHKDYKGLTSLFLDHAPTSVADRFYTTVPQELLNEAISWLGRELQITANTE